MDESTGAESTAIEPYHLGEFAKGGKIDFITQGNVSIPLSIELLRGIIPVRQGEREPSVTEMVMFVNTVIEQKCNCYLNECWLVLIRGKYVPIIAAQKRIAKAQSIPGYDGYEWGWIDKDGNRCACGPENKVKEDDIIGAWGRIHFKDRKVPFYHEIFRSEYNYPKSERKITMLLKTLRDQLHKYAFANEMGNLCTENEPHEEPLQAPESNVPPRNERRMAVPSTAVDTTRAPVVTGVKTEPVIEGQEPSRTPAPFDYRDPTTHPSPSVFTPEAQKAEKAKKAAEEEKPEPEAVSADIPEHVAEAAVEAAPKPQPELHEPVSDEKWKAINSGLVTFVCKECGQTYQYGKKEEGKGKPCSCGKGLLVEVEKQPEPAEPAGPAGKEDAALSTIEEKGDATALYIEVNSLFIAQEGKGFVEFVAYVLCLDESEIAPSKLTEEQLKQIKAYIETSGVAIN